MAHGRVARPESAGSQRRGLSGRVSIVILSRDLAELRRAMAVVAPTAVELQAQVIVVFASDDARVDRALGELRLADVTLVPGSTLREHMCDVAMQVAVGDIIAFRDDTSIGDASFLEAFRLRQRPRGETVVPPRVEPLGDLPTPRRRSGRTSDGGTRDVPGPAPQARHSGDAPGPLLLPAE
jgi:hypothetical protein